MDTSPVLPIPRLRLSRHSPTSRADTLHTPTAGPSISPDALRAHLYVDHDDEDTEATPRIPAARIADSPQATAAPSLPAETPSARLRMLLSRVPNTHTPPRPPAARPHEPKTPSESDSDLDPPYSTMATPSIARESLRELFSHALRDPGTTPRRPGGRTRRNSIGAASEVDPSPRAERVERKRADIKGKRKSMSDEEAEHLSNVSRRSEESSRSSHSQAAERFKALRAMLDSTRSNTLPPTPPPERMMTDFTMPPSETSEDTAALLRELNRPESTPPHATSTPLRSLQLSAQQNGHSNLMDGDSDMRNALGGLDSYEGDSVPDPPPFPSTRPRLNATSPPPSRPASWSPHPKMDPASPGLPSTRKDPVAPARPLSWSALSRKDSASPAHPTSWNSHSKSHSVHNLPLDRRGSEDFHSSASQTSSQSAEDHRDRHGDHQRDKTHERERRRNHPQPKSPAHPHHLAPGRDSPVNRPSLSRRSSVVSLVSTDDGRSSRASSSSVVSVAEQKEHTKELELEWRKEREHGWNKPNSKRTSFKTLNRSSSSLSLRSHERTRSLSNASGNVPSRPDSAQSLLSPHPHPPRQPRKSLSRQSSASSLRSSLSGHSRAASPTGSVASSQADVEEERVIEHERERNWNSPRPKWTEPAHQPSRASSPMPGPLSADGLMLNTPMTVRERTQGLRDSPTSDMHARTRTLSSNALEVSSTIASMAKEKGKALLKSKSPGKSSAVPNGSPGYHSRSPSPARKTQDENEHDESGKSQTSGFRSRFGWSFPSNRARLPPLESDTDADPDSLAKSKPGPPVSTSASLSQFSLKGSDVGASHIPRPASRLGVGDDSTAASARKRGHRRSLTEFSKPNGRIPPPAQTFGVVEPEHGDDSEGAHGIEIEVDTGSDSEPEDEHEQHEISSPSVPQEDMVFASDEESPPATSTPTARPVALPTSPPEPPPDTPAYAPSASQPHDTQSFSRQTTKRDSPPLVPSDNTPPVFSLQTPPRRSPGNGSSSFSSSKLEFRIPSPPRNMPDLPNPPSFMIHDGEGGDEHTPVLTSAPNNLTMMKTPRPPGAWATIPDVRQADPSANRKVQLTPATPMNLVGPSASSVLVNTPEGEAKVDVVAASMPGWTATWPRTPAPPGAWLPTPGTAASARRKSFLKVRFDVESETTASDIGEHPAEQSRSQSERPALPAAWNPNASANSSASVDAARLPGGNATQGDIKEAERPSTPPRMDASAPPRPFRSPGSVSVRVVDAFGRETTTQEPVPPAQEPAPQRVPQRSKTPERKPEQSTARPSTGTPGSRGAVRIVDAMGHEVEDSPLALQATSSRNLYLESPPDAAQQSTSVVEDEGSSMFEIDMPTPTDHNEALALVRETVKSMKAEARQAEKDRSCENRALDERRELVSVLEDASNRARSARRTISQTLRHVESRDAEAEADAATRKSRYTSLRASMAGSTSRFLPSVVSESKLPWIGVGIRSAWLFWVLILVQLMFCLLLYRLSNIRARRMFLTTYYDPFYAELYLYSHSPPDSPSSPNSSPNLSLSNPSSIPPYSAWYAIPATLAQAGWRGALQDMWAGITCALSLSSEACVRASPEVWGNPIYGSGPSSASPSSGWPPT